ncbi:MAG: alpha/beta fold hydrolase [Bdellovibrionales bacterium]
MQECNSVNFIEKGFDKNPENSPLIVWGHGWGQNHTSFLELCAPFEKTARHIMIDFPGFGESAMPSDAWGTKEYADCIEAFIRQQSDQPVIWIGHSFGCRVGLQLAAHYPDLIRGLFLIAGAGIPKQLPYYKSAYFKCRIALYKSLKKLIPFGLSEEWLISKFASRDYKDADPVLRQILVKVVNEDLRNIAPRITCPVHFVYGDQDQETPAKIGEALSGLIPDAKLSLLKGQDHYSVLSSGRHQVATLLKQFIETMKA